MSAAGAGAGAGLGAAIGALRVEPVWGRSEPLESRRSNDPYGLLSSSFQDMMGD